jgi:hypothetical protein
MMLARTRTDDLYGAAAVARRAAEARRAAKPPRSAAQAMRTFFAGPANPFGLHVFVPNFATKAANLIANAEQNRIRLIQAVLTAK